MQPTIEDTIDQRPTSVCSTLVFATAVPDDTWPWDLRALATACRALFDAFQRETLAPDGDPEFQAALWRDWHFLEEMTEQRARARGMR